MNIVQTSIEKPSEQDMHYIHQCIAEFRLDDEMLKKEQFLIAKNDNGRLLGFGRLKIHLDSTELCSLGVLPEYRGQGIAIQLVNALIKLSPSDVYVVCIIPDFFKKMGFKIVKEIPESIRRKYMMCTTKLKVEESYYSMKLEKKDLFL